MVRVGGGWCALDEFLVKNDPCRGKYSQHFTEQIQNDQFYKYERPILEPVQNMILCCLDTGLTVLSVIGL